MSDLEAVARRSRIAFGKVGDLAGDTEYLADSVREHFQLDVPDLIAKLRAARAVCAVRERELLELKGPCSNKTCRLHYAHSGPCDTTSDQGA